MDLISTKSVCKKTVTFYSEIKVILIPCRQEYIECGLISVLWWEPSDYINFRINKLLSSRNSLWD
jgi:hypothetical protein